MNKHLNTLVGIQRFGGGQRNPINHVISLLAQQRSVQKVSAVEHQLIDPGSRPAEDK